MRTIGEQEVWTFAPGSDKASPASCGDIRRNGAHKVGSFMDLATKVAALQYRNHDHVLLFRGQAKDYRNKSGSTSLKPSLLRGKTEAKVPSEETLRQRFYTLERAEELLVNQYTDEDIDDTTPLKRQQILRWAILQHYEVCRTPLLDATQSLRIAASFGTADAEQSGESDAHLFVIGVPNISGAITASAEGGLQIVRLASVCPPSAVRPHIQEGYLLGEYPEIRGYDQKRHYAHYETDFGRRLVAKFKFRWRAFWHDDMFRRIETSALYPSPDLDPLSKLADLIKKRLSPN